MSSVHEPTPVPAGEALTAPSTHSPMSRPQRGYLSKFRGEFFEPASVVLVFGELLLQDAAERAPEQFLQDLRRILDAGRRLRGVAREFFDLEPDEGPDADAGLEAAARTLRHDMLNHLNVVINLCEEWAEDCEDQFLHAFRPDLRRLHGHGKRCLEVLNRTRAAARGEDEPAPPPAPAPAAAEDPLFEWDPPTRPPSPQDVRPGHCLVVDDGADNRDILTRLLLRQGHSVQTAVNGREALQKVAESGFDLVFLDIMMPEMNGFQVLQHLKADERFRGLPVIMISALDQIDSVVHCIELGAEDFLPKPFNKLLLKARIGACLEKKRFRDREVGYLRQIEQEKQRSDELLHVILPEKIVAELKATNEVRPRRHDHVAVLFADLVGFTRYCESHTPEEVVPYLQKLVEAWENSALTHGVEKIKTIGDAFMAASGLLSPVDNPVLQCVRCGLEMIEATRALPIGWDLRVGVHFGQVMAGVIGRRQYLFDLWGDTVNTAARMESHGLPGHITLSPDAWRRLEPLAAAEPRFAARARRQEVKSKGWMEVHDIAGARPAP